MRRLMALLCVLAALTAAARAESGWTEQTWADVRAELYSDAPDPVPEAFRVFVSSAPKTRADEEAGLTVLLMASDAPDMEHNFGRTDLIMLCRIDFATGRIRLLSLPEEALVSLPGLPGEVMLRHVNCFGGPLLVLNTVNGLMDAGVGRYCAVNFEAFQQIVDLLGGVKITLTEGEAQALETKPGETRLNGAQALRYVRLRRQGDGSRRAEKLMAALADTWTAQGSTQNVYRVLDLLLPLLDTNLTTKNLMDAAVHIVGREEPGAFAAEALKANEDGALDESARDALHAFLDGQTP